MYFHKAQEKPRRWGSFQDIQYSIKRNLENIYKCNPDNEVLVMPLFWGFPCFDFSGNNNHGTNHGATYKDSSLDFNGSSSYIDCGIIDVTSYSEMTISACFNADVIATQLLCGLLYSGTDDFRIEMSSAKLISIRFDDGTHPTVSTSFSVSKLSSFHHVVGAHNGSTTFLYLDGAQKNSAADSVNFAGANGLVNIGRRAGTDQYHYDGLIDEVRISNTARTAETIGIFYERPWDLYRRVSRPVYFLPGAVGGVTMPIFIHHQNQMRA